MTFDLRLEGYDRLTAAMRAASPELKKKMRSKLFQVGDIVRDEARQLIHSPRGRARRGITTFVLEPGQGVRGIVARVDDLAVLIRPGRGAAGQAAVFAQRSRGPGKLPPPRKAALAMAKRYGLPPSAARPLALAIARRGTNAKPVMVDALRAKQGEVVDRMRDVTEEIVGMLASK